MFSKKDVEQLIKKFGYAKTERLIGYERMSSSGADLTE